MKKSKTSTKKTIRKAVKAPIVRKTIKRQKEPVGKLIEDKEREIILRQAKVFGVTELIMQLKDPTLMEIKEEVAMRYFGPEEVAMAEALEQGGDVRFFETTNAIIYLSNNGYAGMTAKS